MARKTYALIMLKTTQGNEYYRLVNSTYVDEYIEGIDKNKIISSNILATDIPIEVIKGRIY